MPVFNIPQALLWIGNYQSRKFDPDRLESQLALIAAPVNFKGSLCAPSLTVVQLMFQGRVSLPDAKTRSDVLESLATTIVDPATTIFQNAHDELLRSLMDGKIAMQGREVREPQVIYLKNDAWVSIEDPSGPSIPIDVIPVNSFAELRFIDREGVEAAPKSFPVQKFPRWRDLSLSADDVRRLWPIQRPIAAGKKRGPKPAQLERVKAAMRLKPRAYLVDATEEALAVEFKASRDTCRRALNGILSENK